MKMEGIIPGAVQLILSVALSISILLAYYRVVIKYLTQRKKEKEEEFLISKMRSLKEFETLLTVYEKKNARLKGENSELNDPETADLKKVLLAEIDWKIRHEFYDTYHDEVKLTKETLEGANESQRFGLLERLLEKIELSEKMSNKVLQ